MVATEITNTKSSANQASGNAKGHLKASANIIGSPNPKIREAAWSIKLVNLILPWRCALKSLGMHYAYIWIQIDSVFWVRVCLKWDFGSASFSVASFISSTILVSWVHAGGKCWILAGSLSLYLGDHFESQILGPYLMEPSVIQVRFSVVL